MPYEQQRDYLRIFDRGQSPLWIRTLALRAGVPALKAHTYIDLGCAAGHSTLSLAPMYPDTHFIGIDFNARHIAQATEEAKKLVLRNCSYQQADFRVLPAELPHADIITVRGIYSWLEPEVKAKLEEVMGRLAKPGTLLQVHYSVLPGASLRGALGQVLKILGGTSLSPQKGREIADVLRSHAPVLNHYLPEAQRVLAYQRQQPDELWVHDFLNEHFDPEYADKIMQRLATRGYGFVAATELERNLPMLLVDETVSSLMASLEPIKAQALLDVFLFHRSRSDLFIQGAGSNWSDGSYPKDTRFGVIVPDDSLFTEYAAPNGTLKFQNPNIRAVLDLLQKRPYTVVELENSIPQLSSVALRNCLDLLWAGGKVAPFLGISEVAAVDRERLRQLNRQRIRSAAAQLHPEMKVPLLAAEYGNCLTAGWFETLVLANYQKRNQIHAHREMLNQMRKIGLVFPGANGRPADDQLKCIKTEIGKLELNYLSKIEYWGIEI